MTEGARETRSNWKLRKIQKEMEEMNKKKSRFAYLFQIIMDKETTIIKFNWGMWWTNDWLVVYKKYTVYNLTIIHLQQFTVRG